MQGQRREGGWMQRLKQFLGAIFIGYLVTLIGILALALILLLFSVTEAMVDVGVLLIYVISCIACGYFTGKNSKLKFWGGMLAGGYYEGLLLIISYLLHGSLEKNTKDVICLLALCMASGALGGMFSYKK